MGAGKERDALKMIEGTWRWGNSALADLLSSDFPSGFAEDEGGSGLLETGIVFHCLLEKAKASVQIATEMAVKRLAALKERLNTGSRHPTPVVMRAEPSKALFAASQIPKALHETSQA